MAGPFKPIANSPRRSVTLTEFAVGIRDAVPQFQGLDIADEDLVAAWMEEYPQTSQQVDIVHGLKPLDRPPMYKPPVAPAPPGFEDPGTFIQHPSGLERKKRRPGEMPLLDAPLSGGRRAIEGVQLATARGASGMDRLEGVNETIEGAMEALTPVAVGLGLAHPVIVGTGLAAGVIGTEGGRHVLEKSGAPPEVARFGGNVTGILTGGRAVGKQGAIEMIRDLRSRAQVKARARAIPAQQAPHLERAQVEEGAAYGRARQVAIEAQASANAADAARGQQNVNRLRKNLQELDKLQRGLAYNEALNQIAADQTAQAAGPFAYLDQVNETTRALPPAPPLLDLIGREAGAPIDPFLATAIDSYARVPPALGPEPPPMLALPPASGPTILAAPADMPVPQIEPVGRGPAPGRYPPVAQIAPEPPQDANALIRSIGEQLIPQFGGPDAPPLAHTPDMRPRHVPTNKIRRQEAEAYRSAFQNAQRDILGEMRDVTHERGRSVTETVFDDATGEEGYRSYYVPPTPGASVYWDIVGRQSTSPPTRKLIADVIDLYVNSDGAKNSRELIGTNVYLRLNPEYGPRALLNAYDRWRPQIAQAIDKRARQYRQADARRAAGESDPAWDAYLARRAEEEGGAGAVPIPERMPDWMIELTGVPPEKFADVPDGWDPDLEGPMPGTRIQHGGRTYEGISAKPGEKPSYRLVNEPEGPPQVGSVGQEGQDAIQVGDRITWDTHNLQGAVVPREGVVTEVLPNGDYRAQVEGMADPRYVRPGLRPRKVGGESEPPIPGLESVLTTENPTPPVAPPVQPSFDLTPPPPAAPKQESLLAKFIRDEEGSLRLPRRSEAGIKEWLDAAEDEFGDASWYRAAREAFDSGDWQTAWRAGVVGAGTDVATTAARGSGERREGFQTATLPPVVQDRILAQAEKLTGESLPKGTKVGPGGVLVFPKNPGGLETRLSDLTLGKVFVKDATEAIDWSKIIRLETEEGKLIPNIPSELRVYSQMADQIVQSMPKEVFEDLASLTGLNRAEYGAHLARSISNAGKLLNVIKQAQDDNWDLILHLNPDSPNTKGPGAAGREEFFPEGRVAAFRDFLTKNRKEGDSPADTLLRWAEQAPPEERSNVSFKLPKGVAYNSPEGKIYARNWLQRARRLEELGKQLDLLTEGSKSPLDRVMLADALGKEKKAGEIANAMENTSRAFLLVQPITALRNLWSQGARYSLGMVDEVLAGVAALPYDRAESLRHFTLAKELGTSTFRRGTTPTGLLKAPWSDALEVMYNYTTESLRGLSKKDAKRMLNLLQQFPEQEMRFTGGISILELPGSEAAASKVPILNKLVDPRLRNMITVLTRFQESSFRTTVFDAHMRTAMRMRGLEPDEIMADPRGLVDRVGVEEADRMVGGAVSAALDATFAANPYPGSIQGVLIDLMSNIPVVSPLLRMAYPFPRFSWVNAPRWIYDHSPMALFDLPAYVFGKGRLYKGTQGKAIETRIIPQLVAQINEAKGTAARALGDYMAAKETSSQAARTFKSLEAKLEKGSIPELEAELRSVAQTMHQQAQVADTARATHTASNMRVKDLEKLRKQEEVKLRNIKEIAAPTMAEYVARMTTGAMLFKAATLMRSSEGAKDTKYYEYRFNVGGSDVLVDLRPFGPFAQVLLPADVMVDVERNTDWEGVRKFFESEGKSHLNPAAWEEAIRENYSGKYTAPELRKDVLSAFFTMSSAGGTTAALGDWLTGRQGGQTEGLMQSAMGALLGVVGSFIGRFSTPARVLSDVLAVFDSDAQISRIPEERGEQGGALPAGELLTGPFRANVPGLRGGIEEKISPLTGKPLMSSPLPELRLFAGVNTKVQGQIERELTRTGLPYGAAVPRQTGDREYDNTVNREYAQIVGESFSELLNDPDYKALPPAGARLLLEKYFNSLRTSAAGVGYDLLLRRLVGGGMELEEAEVEARLKQMSPAARQRQKDLRKYFDLAVKEGPQEPEPPQ